MCQLLLKVLILLVAVTVIVNGNLIESRSRQKRLIIGFAQFISLYTKRNPLDYNNYGCWCGSGNKKQTVMDGIDACCKAHDQCYQGWGSSASYYLINNYDCNKMMNGTPARYKACMCDKTAAQCFARNKYNPKMKGRCI